MDIRSPFFQNIACVLIGVLFLNPIVSTAAELTVAAGSGASVGAAGNGVPVVNIATPNGNGLSHNKFTDYNVGQQGLILNNASGATQSTQLGGYILGNPNLKNGAANLILNEVTGPNASQLKGYTEVAGKSAHVIVANPHGIACDGCGFLNTPRVTLSTGKPIVENGRLDRFDVDGGQIAIEGAGLNASNVDQFDLITRSAKINAELHAKQLNVITGRNDVKAADLSATAKAAGGSDKPQLAIDSSALGGMYAGAIRLVGTEAGVGVKLAGDLAASAGDIQIDANGKLTMAQAAASRDLVLKAESVELNAAAYAGRDARLEADRVIVTQSLASGGDLRVTANQLDNVGVLEAGIQADGSLNAASTLELNGGTLNNRGQVVAHGRLSTDLQTLDNAGSTLVSAGDASLKAQTLNNAGGTLIGQQALTLRGGELNNQAGTLASNQALDIQLDETLDNSADGLVLSKAGGLTLQAKQVLNQNGTVHADVGSLNVTAETLDNRQGQVTAGNGALTLNVDTLDNQQGRLIAEGGALTVTSATTDNRQGRIQADALNVSASQQLNNADGDLVATQAEQTLVAGQLDNQRGRITAKSELDVTAASLDNSHGIVGAEHIALDVDGALTNSDGLIESSTTLALQAGSVSNANGKLRALSGVAGSQSSFTIAGQFDNDNGLVEIGNGTFSLTSQGLSNQAGSVRHVGGQGFNLALADVGNAGGSFLTNGVLQLNVADWFNSSLLQAQRITLDVRNFTQAASGKLISAESIVATGDTWHNDGSIETDGELSLTLTGAYTGAGKLLSQSGLTFTADSARLDAGAEVRSGGDSTFTTAGALSSAGTLTATGDLTIKASNVRNLGTLGASGVVDIDAAAIHNERGLLFSGSHMQLLTDSLINLYGDLYSLGWLSVAKDQAGSFASLIENRSGGIESAGDMSLRATSLINRKEQFATKKTQTAGSVSVVCYDCSGDHHNVDYVATESFNVVVDPDQDSPAARLHSGGDLDVRAGAVVNRFSTLSASGDIDITATTLENTGAATGTSQRVRRFNTGRVTDGTDERFRDAHVYPYNAQPLPKELPSAYYRWALVSDIETQHSTGSGAPAIIQAGGNVNIQASQSITSASVLDNQAPQSSSDKTASTQVNGSGQPLLVTLSAQLPADPRQQAVDPLALPGFTLPQGQHGLFHLATDPGHPYLIETNPALTSLKQFLNSSYLLDRLGYDSEASWKRLGDGLYEQRLIQQAVVARTGKRFLAGLNSDEAMFRHLMDNAIASKEALSLSVGIRLTAEQVAALTHDIVWMEEREVLGQKVLVPVLYLAQANDRLAPNGALIQGQDLALISGGELKSSGTLRASRNLDITASNIENKGLMQAGERVSLLAMDSIRNAQGGIINGRDVSAIALTGDISNERTITQDQRSGKGYSQTTSVVDKAARFEATNTLEMSAGGDLRNIGGALSAGGNADLSAGGDVVLGAAQAEGGLMRKDKRHYWNNSTITQYGSDVQVGGDLAVEAGQDLTVVASKLKAGGDIALSAAGDVDIASAANESSNEYRYKRGSKKRINKENTTVRQQASEIEAGGDLLISADNDLTVSASRLKAGGDAQLYAGNDVSLLAEADQDYSYYEKSQKKKRTFGGSSSKTVRKESTTVRQQGVEIETGGDLLMSAEGDMALVASKLKAGGEAYLYAGNDIGLLTAENLDQSSSYTKKKSGGLFSSKKSALSEASSSQAVSTSIQSGSDLTLVANNDLAARGAQLSSAEAITLYAGQNLLLDAAENTASQASGKSKNKLFSSKASTKSSEHTSLTSTSLDGKSVELLADNDITLRAAAVHAEEGIVLGAGRDIAISTAQQSQQSSQASKSNKLNWHLTDSLATNGSFTLENKAKGGQQSSVQEVGSTLSGGTIDIDSGRDTSIRGSTLVADGAIRIDAARHLSVVSGETRNTSSASSKTKNTGEIGNWYQGATGVASLKENNTNSSVTQTASQIASLGGDVELTAGERYRQVASHVIAPTGDVSIIAKQVDIEAGYDKLSATQKQSSNRTAVGGTVSVPLVDAVRNIQQMSDAAGKTEDSRLKTLAAVNTAMDAQRGYEAAQAMGSGNLTGIKISVNLSNSKGSSSSSQSGQNVVASTIAAGGDVNISAVGDGKNSNLNVVGSQIDATHDVNLKAGGDINLLSAQNTAQLHGKNANSGWSVGVGFGLGSQNGFTLDLAANKGKGYSEGESVTHSNTAVRAGDTVNLISGEDTTLKGAVVSANQVKAQVGGDLNLASQQDIDNYKSKQQDASVGVSLCIPPFCYGASSSANAAFSQQKIDSRYASVTEQTGIKAGDGGFQIDVKGNTDLKGAVIASTDKAVADGKNSLTTGTLTHSDIKNEAEYKATSLSLSGGYSGNAYDKQGNVIKGADGKPLHEPGVTAGTPIALSASDKDSSRTQSGISGGQITITDEARQRQLTGESADEAVAGVNRDVSSDKDGSNTLGKIFDREEIEAGFAITRQFVQNVGTFLAERAQESTNAKRELAAEMARPEQERDPQRIDQLKRAIAENQTWEVGGTGRTLMMALSGAAGGNVTGGSSQFLQSAAVNYLQALAVEQVKHVADSLDSEAARVALHAVVGCAGAAAQSQSCSSGALGGSASVVLNNLLNSLSGLDASGMTDEEKQTRLNLIGNLVAGITAAAGGDAAVAANAAQIETGNNFLGPESQAQREKAREALLQNRYTADTARQLVMLERADQLSDELLEKYITNPESMTRQEFQALQVYLQIFVSEQIKAYGEEQAQRALMELLYLTTPKDYYPYAGSNQAKDAAREIGGYADWFNNREPSENEQLYRDALGIIRTGNQQEELAKVGEPAIYLLGGGLGNTIRAVAVANGAVQTGVGIRQATEGDYWNAAGNVLVGVLGMSTVALPGAKVPVLKGSVADKTNHIGAAWDLPKATRWNPSAEAENCIACVASYMTDRLNGKAGVFLTADDVERIYASVHPSRGLQLTEAVAILHKAAKSDTPPVVMSPFHPDAPVGQYALFFGPSKDKLRHVVHAEVLPNNGGVRMFDPQNGQKVLVDEIVSLKIKWGGSHSSPVVPVLIRGE